MRTMIATAILSLILGLIPLSGTCWSQSNATDLFDSAKALHEKAKSKKDLQEALAEYQKALESFKEQGNAAKAADTSIRIAEILVKLDRVKDAQQHLETALDTFRRFGSPGDQSRAIRPLARVHKKMGEFQRAEEYFLQALAIARQAKVKKGEAQVLMELGSLPGPFDKREGYYQKALTLFRELGDEDEETKCLQALGYFYRETGNYNKAIALWTQALDTARAKGWTKREAIAAFQLGQSYRFSGRLDDAARYFNEALKVAEDLKDLNQQTDTLIQLGDVASTAKKHADAEASYRKALDINAQSGSVRGQATCLRKLGWLHRLMHQYSEAEQFFQQSLELFKKCGDAYNQGETLRELSSMYKASGQYSKAIRLIEEAIAISAGTDDRLFQDNYLGELGLLHNMMGNYQEAVSTYERAFNLHTERRSLAGQASALMSLGSVNMEFGRYDQAQAYYEKALAIQRQIGDSRGEQFTLETMGLSFWGTGKYSKALELYREAQQIARKQGDVGSEGRSLALQGMVWAAMGDHQIAIELLRKSAALQEKSGDGTGAATSLVDASLLYANRGMYNEALAAATEAVAWCEKAGVDQAGQRIPLRLGLIYLYLGEVDKAEPFLGKPTAKSDQGFLYLMKSDFETARGCFEQALAEANNKALVDELFTANTGLGRCYEGLGDLDRAETHYRKAMDLTEALRSELTPDKREQFFSVRMGFFFRTEPYEGLARVLMLKNKQRDAFTISEYTKARVFAESIARHRGQGVAGVPQGVLDKERELIDRMAALKTMKQKAFEQGRTEVVANLEPQIKELEGQLNAHISMLRAKYPLLAATRYPQPMELSETALKDHERVLSYDVTDSGVIIYLTKGKQLLKALFKPIPRKQLDDLVEKFRQPLSSVAESKKPLKELESFDFNSAKRLSELLISDILTDLPEGAPLVIVPDESLGVLPFEALVLNDGGRVVHGKTVPCIEGAEFFGDRNPICYYQSVTALTLARLFGKDKKPGAGLLAMTDPVFEPDDSRFAHTTVAEKPKFMGPVGDTLMSIRKETGLTWPRLELTAQLGAALQRLETEGTEVFS